MTNSKTTLSEEIEKITFDLENNGAAEAYWQERGGDFRPTAKFKEATQQLLTLIKKVGEKIIGDDLRHITDTKGENNHTGDVDADEIINNVQTDIDTQNELKKNQRQTLKDIVGGKQEI